MPTVENDQIVFRFPKTDARSKFSIEFQRTLRVPDTDKEYALPPGLGAFRIRHAEDYKTSLAPEVSSRGGVILPMWQAEAMWINFEAHDVNSVEFPVAIKVATGKINAVTGSTWDPELQDDPQDYVVSPEQPWLDGYCVDEDLVRQFVAMPLGSGYSIEEQVSGDAEWGGLQISVCPLKPEIWRSYLRRNQPSIEERYLSEESSMVLFEHSAMMGLGAGGKITQTIYDDPFCIDAWDESQAQRVFVHLLHAKDWLSVTGNPAPNEPPSAKDYSSAGLPWFAYYGSDQAGLSGNSLLAAQSSVGQLFKKKTGAELPNSTDIDTGPAVKIGPNVEQKLIKESTFLD